MAKLTYKQQKFCDEYMKDLNGAAAAIRAGYSANSAKEIASELLTKPNIREIIEIRQAELAAKAHVDTEYVVRKLKEIVENTIIEDPTNANKALTTLSKYTGGFTDKVEMTGNLDIAATLKEARERVSNKSDKE